MSAQPHLPASASLWDGRALVPREDCDVAPARILVADSWLVVDGAVRGLDLHRDRFLSSIATLEAPVDAHGFWDAAIEAIPRAGDWFPRIELREQFGAPQLIARMRDAPERRRSVVLSTHAGRDPRTEPAIKGPDLAAMLRLRTEAQGRGADEAVIVGDTGLIVEGSTTSLCWWRGGTVCIPDAGLTRVDGVTMRTVLALATALGIPISEERATPADLDGLEVWALNALHGIRIVTSWESGPTQLAEDPGRLATWELRLNALRRPLPDVPAAQSAPECSL